MGQAIEALGLSQGHAFPLIIDIANRSNLRADRIKGIDVVLEFTTPETAPGNILKCFEMGIPVVSGTTGWNDRFGEIEDFCRKKEGAFFYASNYSIGVNILFAMNRKLAGIMDRFPEYKVSMEEVHHLHKLDAPSGTAITLAEQIISEQERVHRWSLESGHDQDTMHINAVREGEVLGKHTIRYESGLEAISLGHEARSRDVFAAGALMAAAYIHGRQGIFGMNDLLKI